MAPERLASACEETLLAALPVPVKAAIDAALRAGARPAEIMARVASVTGGPEGRVVGGRRVGGLTYLAAATFLEQRCRDRGQQL